MKTRHYRVIKNKISSKDFNWLKKQIKKYFLVFAGSKIRRPLSGPILGGIIVTYRCNLQCIMCDYVSKNNRYSKLFSKEMDVADFKIIIDQYAELGVSGIGFTGGEPLLYHDLEKLIVYAQSKKILTSVGTNGVLLDAERSKKILDTGVSSVQISLDAPDAKIHDAIRGVEGSFSKAVKGIQNIVKERNEGKYNTKLIVSMCITSENHKYILEMIETARNLGVDNISFIGFESMAIKDNVELNNNMPKITLQLQEEIDRSMDVLIEHKKKSDFIDNSIYGLKLMKHQFRGGELPIKCYVDYSSLYVDCYGNIFPCQGYVEMGKAIDHIDNGTLKKLWYSKQYGDIRSSLAKCRECFFPCHSELSSLFSIRSHLC